MSTNLLIMATRPVITRDGKWADIQKDYFHVYQTPTDITKQIIKTSDPIQAYKDWVLSIDRSYTKYIYYKEDLFEEVPIGKELANFSQEHVDELDQWFKNKEATGWTVNPITI